MNKKLKSFGILLLLAILISIQGVLGADPTPTVSTGSEQTFTGTNTLTVTIADQANISGLILYYRNTTSEPWFNLGFNGTANLTTYTFRWVSTTQVDSSTAQLNATARNYTMASTTGNISSALVSINVDNTVPVITQYRIDFVSTAFKTVPYDCDFTDLDANSNTSRTIVLVGPQGSVTNQTSASKSGSITFLNGFGEYTTSCDVIDGQGQRSRSSYSITYHSEDEEDQIRVYSDNEEDQISESKKNAWIYFGAIIFVFAIFFMIYSYYKRK